MGLCYVHGNDAAIQIAVSTAGSVQEFANLMNEKAKSLGLQNTHFVTPHGLDEDEHYTTAYELATLSDYALDNEEFAKIVKTKSYAVNIDGRVKNITNTNELLGCLEGVNGVKTGFTNKAGRCLVTSINRDGFSIITVVLGADTKKIRTRDSINLIEYIYQNYEIINIKEIIEREFNLWKKEKQKDIYIYKGMIKNIELELEKFDYTNYPIKKSDLNSIIVNIEIITKIEAPINKNVVVGNLSININNQNIGYIEIVTKEEIKRKGIMRYFLEIFGEIKNLQINSNFY